MQLSVRFDDNNKPSFSMITDSGRKKLLSKKQMLAELKKIGYSDKKAYNFCVPKIY